MATLKDLKKQLENANALGLDNLAKKGVVIGGEATPSAYDIMNSISQIRTIEDGAILNIAYGETAPEDTSKLWIKANEPENIIFSRSVEGSNEISEIGNMPDNAYYVGCVPIGEKVYIMGGTNGSNNVRYITYYDTQTGTITVSATVTVGYSYGGYGSACGAVGTTIHYFSGYMNNYGSNKYARFRSAYDTVTDTKTGEEDSSIGYRSCFPMM